ncbi:hypothetical protein GCM10009091_53830 [Pseudomonas brenneri]|nr:hypothetical protein GCM10009091_53830 [Pseudomonas brenneri]
MHEFNLPLVNALDQPAIGKRLSLTNGEHIPAIFFEQCDPYLFTCNYTSERKAIERWHWGNILLRSIYCVRRTFFVK